MHADLIESTFASPLVRAQRLNRDAGVISGTTIIGAASLNGVNRKRRYSDHALQRIAAMAEGLPAYLNHVAPELAFKPRDVRDLIGVHRNVRYDPGSKTVTSDLHLAEHQAPLVFSLADRFGDRIGNSLVSRGLVAMEGDVEVVQDIVQVRSADLVSDPASTTGLFESAVTELREGLEHVHAQLRAALTGQPRPTVIPAGVHDQLARAFRGGV